MSELTLFMNEAKVKYPEINIIVEDLGIYFDSPRHYKTIIGLPHWKKVDLSYSLNRLMEKPDNSGHMAVEEARKILPTMLTKYPNMIIYNESELRVKFDKHFTTTQVISPDHIAKAYLNGTLKDVLEQYAQNNYHSFYVDIKHGILDKAKTVYIDDTKRLIVETEDKTEVFVCCADNEDEYVQELIHWIIRVRNVLHRNYGYAAYLFRGEDGRYYVSYNGNILSIGRPYIRNGYMVPYPKNVSNRIVDLIYDKYHEYRSNL